MGDEELKVALANAHQAFREGKLKEAERILLRLPQDNMKIKHNLAAVQYLLDVLDAETTISILEADLHPAYRSRASSLWTMHKALEMAATAADDAKGGSKEKNGERIPDFALLYEGHETAIYNLATILARCGHAYDASVLLRRLLQLGKNVEKGVLGRSLCLFHALTSSSVMHRSGTCEDEAADAALENNTLNLIMEVEEEHDTNSSAKSAPGKENVKEHILQLFSYISDSNVLVEAIKDIQHPMEKAMALNNLGAFAIKDKKPYVAILCFQKAEELMLHSTSKGMPPSPFSTFSLSSSPAALHGSTMAATPATTNSATGSIGNSSTIRSDGSVGDCMRLKQRLLLLPIRYNAGLCALLREEFDRAIQHLLSVQESMKSSPVFWVRLGEAALGELQKHKRELQQREYTKRQCTFSQLIHCGHVYENFEFLLLPNAQMQPGPFQELCATPPLWPLSSSSISSSHHSSGAMRDKTTPGGSSDGKRYPHGSENGNEMNPLGQLLGGGNTSNNSSHSKSGNNSKSSTLFSPPLNRIVTEGGEDGVKATTSMIPPKGEKREECNEVKNEKGGEKEEEQEEERAKLADKCNTMEGLASVALQNALFLLIPPGFTYANARTAFPSQETLLSYALLYWTCLELHRENYTAVEVIGQALLEWNEVSPSSPTTMTTTNRNQSPASSRLPPNLHATLLCYLVEALVHLNVPEKAMRVLRTCQPSCLITGTHSNSLPLTAASGGGGTSSSAATSGAGFSSGGGTFAGGGSNSPHHTLSSLGIEGSHRSSSFMVDHGPDVAQRSRVEVLLLHAASTQILCGAWPQAASTMECLISKIFDSAPAGATEFKPEADALFVYQLLCIFLELAQGKQAEAAELLQKLRWSI